jgi:hypothetical protein
VLGSRHAFEVVDGVVDRVAVAMVDLSAPGTSAEHLLPDIDMQASFAALKIAFALMKAVEDAIEVLVGGVEHLRISEPGARLVAEVHPRAVKNKCSAVQFTVSPSRKRTATSGAFLLVIRGSR